MSDREDLDLYTAVIGGLVDAQHANDPGDQHPVNDHDGPAGARRGDLDRGVALRLAETEYQRVAGLLASLSLDQWSASTECPGWDVRAMAGHMLGTIQMVASVPEMARQQGSATKRAKREGA